MAEYNIDDLSQNKILDLISSKFSITEIEDLEGLALCASNVSHYFHDEIDCSEKRADFCNSCLFSRKSRPKLLDLLRNREKLNTMVEDKKVKLQVIRPINNTVDDTIHLDWPIGHKTWVDLRYITDIGKMNVNLHPEDNKHRMNVPATYFAPINPSDFKGPFKVGDWVEITKSNTNWTNSMDNFIGKKVQITEVCNNGWGIRFNEDSHRFSWNYYQGHFIPCESQMHTTIHAKSGAPKENRKYSIKEIETDPKLLIYLDSKIDYIKITAHLKYNNLSYYPEKCHNFNQQLYCSASGLDNVGSFPEDSIILVYEDIDLNIEEKEREGGGILIKSNSKYSSISNILKRIKI